MESNKDKIQRIKKELKNDPLNVESMIKLAEAYFCELRFKKSSKIFEELLTMDKNSDEYWFLYGMSLYYSNQSEEAIAAFKRAREINPEFSNAEAYIDFIIEQFKKFQDYSIPDLNFLTLITSNNKNIKNTLKYRSDSKKESISKDILGKKGKNKINFFHNSLRYNKIQGF